MEADPRRFEGFGSARNLKFNDPLVIGASAFALGFALGSGRWNWLGKEAGKLADSLVSLALSYASHSLHEQHPELFQEKAKVTH